MGFPIDRIVLAHNANRTVPDFLATGELRPRPSVPTLASAMDVGNPSNLERLLWLFPHAQALAAQLQAQSVDDDAIRARIRADHSAFGETWCPHTATAAEVYANLPQAERLAHNWVLVATAHPAKFREIVEPLVGPVPVPENLRALFELPSKFVEIDPTLAALRSATDALTRSSVRSIREQNRLILTIVLVVLGIGLLFFVARAWRLRSDRKKLHQSIIAVGIEALHNVLVPDGMGASMHVDYLLLTSRGVLVIDLRDLRGNIFGGDQMTEWTVMNGPARTTFQNPQHALYDRVAAVRQLAGDLPVEGRVLFTRSRQVSQGPAALDTDGRFTAHGISARRIREAAQSWVDRYRESWTRLSDSVAPSPLRPQRSFLAEVFTA